MLIGLLIAVVVIGLIVWVIQMVPMPQYLRGIIALVVVIILLAWVFGYGGIR